MGVGSTCQNTRAQQLLLKPLQWLKGYRIRTGPSSRAYNRHTTKGPAGASTPVDLDTALGPP